MPRFFRRRRVPRARLPYRRRRNFRRRNRLVKRGRPTWFSGGSRLSPFPKTMKLMHRYVEQELTLDPASIVLADYVFSANGLYDPNVTGVGHQPIGFDQMIAIYNHYCVIGSKITVNWIMVDTTATESATVGITLTDSNTALTDAERVIENGHCVYTVITNEGGSKDQAQLTLKASPAKFLGRFNPMSEDNMKGSSGANPQEQCYFHVFANSFAGADLTAIRMMVKIEYIAVWLEPKQLVQS